MTRNTVQSDSIKTAHAQQRNLQKHVPESAHNWPHSASLLAQSDSVIAFEFLDLELFEKVR